jgi:RNA polymerase sigma-70 factor (ECF subfamily)
MKDLDAERRWQRLIGLLEPIHERASGTARNLCRSPGDGDDLYQEAVLRAYHKLDTLRDETRFRSWFFAVLLSLHRSRSRRAFWKRFLPLEDTPDDDRNLVGEDGRMNEEEFLSARRAARALSRLPAEQREALVLHELEGFSMEEIAAMQGATIAAVKSRVLRGRERLRRHYRTLGLARTEPLARAISEDAHHRSQMTGVRPTEALAPAYSSFADGNPKTGGRHA